MTESSRRAVVELAPVLGGGKSCRALMENLRGRMSDVDLAPVGEAQVKAIEIRGSNAVVRDNVFDPTVELRKQTGEWRVEFPGLETSPYPAMKSPRKQAIARAPDDNRDPPMNTTTIAMRRCRPRVRARLVEGREPSP